MIRSSVSCARSTSVTRLSLTKYFHDCWLQFVSQKWSQKYDKLIVSFTDMQDTLDVAIAKNSRNLHAILCYRFATHC